MKRILRHIIISFGLALSPLMVANATPAEGVPPVEVPAATMKVSGHQLVITITDDAQHQVLVYALTGQLVKQLTVGSGSTSVELTPGYYIVKIDQNSQRIVVR